METWGSWGTPGFLAARPRRLAPSRVGPRGRDAELPLETPVSNSRLKFVNLSEVS